MKNAFYRFLSRLAEPKLTLIPEKQYFSNKDLVNLIVPVVIEQLLTMLVGVVDTLMISAAGDAAVSGVSLVNQIVMVFIVIFNAIALGGSILTAQFIGCGDNDRGSLAAGQMIMLTTLLSLLISAFVFFCGERLFTLLFGSVEQSVFSCGIEYQRIVAYSFPFLAVYSCCAGMFRSMGYTKTVTNVSIWMNVINVAGNYIGVYVMHAGVAGVAWPTFASRVFAAGVLLFLAFDKKRPVYLQWHYIFCFRGAVARQLFSVATPSALENGIFQIAKVALSSIVALFGTAQIAANGVAQTFWNLAALFVMAVSPAFTAVIGQCTGRGDEEATEYYMRKLLRITYASNFLWCLLMIVISPLALQFFSLSEEAASLALVGIIMHAIGEIPVSPLAFPMASGLRAAGDVRYAAGAQIFCTVVVRLVLAYLLGVVLDLKFYGITLAMIADWTVKAVLVWARYRSGKWKNRALV